MVAKVLEFVVTISPLLSFALMPCISPGAINGIGFEEFAPTKGAFDSLK